MAYTEARGDANMQNPGGGCPYYTSMPWGSREGLLKLLSLRTRCAVVKQDGGDVDDLTDSWVVCSHDAPLQGDGGHG